MGLKGSIFSPEIGYFYFLWMNKKQRSCDVRGGGREAPLLAVNEPKKTGARSARARTRGQNPLVCIEGKARLELNYFLSTKHIVIHLRRMLQLKKDLNISIFIHIFLVETKQTIFKL